MTHPFDLDAACTAALKRLQESLNRSAAQHRMHLNRLAISIWARPLRTAESRAAITPPVSAGKESYA
jgi:hypothetical protein